MSEEGSLIVTKFYFDQLLEEEKENIIEINRSINKEMKFTDLANIQEVKNLLEDFILICEDLVPRVYENLDEEIKKLEADKDKLKTGSKLVRHCVLEDVPCQLCVLNCISQYYVFCSAWLRLKLNTKIGIPSHPILYFFIGPHFR